MNRRGTHTHDARHISKSRPRDVSRLGRASAPESGAREAGRATGHTGPRGARARARRERERSSVL